MVYDKNLASLFLMNFKEAYRSAKLLILSHQRISVIMPLTAINMGQLSLEEMDKLDAFRVRFCDLQDSLGAKIFRTLLKLEEESFESQLDIINKMDKRKIIASFADWKSLRDVRNLFSHDYPDSDEQRAESLNIAFNNTMRLIDTLDNVKDYVETHLKIPLDKFTFFNKKFEDGTIS